MGSVLDVKACACCQAHAVLGAVWGRQCGFGGGEIGAFLTIGRTGCCLAYSLKVLMSSSAHRDRVCLLQPLLLSCEGAASTARGGPISKLVSATVI